MPNPSKAKGDAMEREIVAVLIAMAPDLCVERAERMLGAGRRDDIGDLRVFDDVTVQVKAYKDLIVAIRLASEGAVEQQARAGTSFAVGMSPIPRASKASGAVRWLAAAIEWPAPEVGERASTESFTNASSVKAVAWLADRTGDLPIDERVAEIVRPDKPALWVGPVQAWLRDYRRAIAVGAAVQAA